MVHDDLAVLELAGPLPSSTPVATHAGFMQAGTTLALVGYGWGGDGLSGDSIPSSATVKRLGYNRADVLLADDDGSGVPEMFLFDFDGPTLATNRLGPNVPANGTLGAGIEATLGSGDSGSASFVRLSGGAWALAGINTFRGSFAAGPSTPGLFGTAGGGVLLAPYADWITLVTAPVPEPGPLALFTCGSLLVAATTQRGKGVSR